MSNAMQSMVAQAAQKQVKQGVIGRSDQSDEVTQSETRSRSIVGPVTFKLSNLDVRGLGNSSADPDNSQYIVAADEFFICSVDVEFNKTPLTELLMCLGTRIRIDFGLEGFGVRAAELNIDATVLTQKNVYKYRVETSPVRPTDLKMPSGLYEIGAVATVGPVENPCTTKIWGHGYIQEILLQVYPAGQE
jgi:hypothetical protein